MAASCWTEDQRKLIAKLVRRHAFDFDKASEAFQAQLRGAGVDFSPEETSPTSLRKAFASLGRTPSTCTGDSSPLRRSREPPHLMRTSRDGNKGASNLEGISCSPNSDLNDDHAIGGKKSSGKSFDLNEGALDTHGIHKLKPEQRESNRRLRQNAALRGEEPEQGQVAKGVDTFGFRGIQERTPDPSWTFETMLQEQRRKEVQHEAQKERTFQRVLSALGGPTEHTADLPPDVLAAWEARNENLVMEAEDTKLRQQKLKDDRDLALQREALLKRHLPGSEDSVGEDPLATSPTPLAIPPAHSAFDSAGPVRLELGMDAEMLDKILDELDEESTAAGGYRETNSELSRILDVLDEAAGDAPAASTLLADTQGGRQ